MDHESQVEKLKYRNWVRAGLAYKYLKEGIEGFADEVVIQEHNRILQKVNHRPGLTCDQCNLGNLKPLHNSKIDPSTGKTACPLGQVKCNCLFKNKRPCRNQVCDAIFEEILEAHWSTPPSPNWKNVDITKWCSTPWEVAKCFINAPGYADKTTASDIDAPGLLHIFINNINLQTNLTCKITGTDVLNRVLKRRNTIFHSPTMELEDKELYELIDDVIKIIEDEKELKANEDAIKAVEKLRQLMEDAFIITTHAEVEVCRAAMASIDTKYEELKQTVEDCKSWIKSKEAQVQQKLDNAKVEIDTKRSHSLKSFHDETEQAKKELNKQNDIRFQILKQMIDSLKVRVRDIEQDNAVFKQRLTEVENSVNRIDVARTAQQKQLEYVEQKQACQRKILDLYRKHYVKTGISPLGKQDSDININEVYVTPRMTVETKSKTVEGNPSSKTDNVLNQYRNIFQTDNALHKNIYIVGDVGSGKSSLSKIMIYNWCKALKMEDKTNATPANDNAPQSSEEFDDTNEMRRFNFVFFISLQRLSGYSSSLVEMIRLYYKDIVTSELLDRILAEESEHCLIIADGLDEWTPSKTEFRPEHVSYGLPLTDGLQNATVITLSRPSAKGILNMKPSEYDLKIMLQGIDSSLINEFIKKYMSKQSRNQNSFKRILHEIRKINIEHLEKTPLLLQQLVWMYCMGHGIGKTVGEIYSNVVNIMFGWSKRKDNVEDEAEGEIRNPNEFIEMQLPLIFKRFPRCEANKRYILQLGKIAFNAFTAESTNAFGLSSLLNSGFSKNDIATLTSVGVLVEYNYIDPTYDYAYFSFIHRSYLEFFAAVYISSQNGRTTALERLFNKYTHPAGILQLSNLLEMVCGLSAVLLGKISELISINVTNDKNMIRYRKNLHDHMYPSFSKAQQLHELMYDCSCECKTGDQPVVSLCDIIIRKREHMSFLRKIIPSSVLSLHLYLYNIDIDKMKQILKWAENLPRLQYICINGRLTFKHQCNLMQATASFIQELVSVKHLSLVDMTCSHPDHVSYLSKHNQLRRIYLENCQLLSGSLTNTKYLENVHISSNASFVVKHGNLTQLSLSLSKAAFLKHLTLEGIRCSLTYCRSHTFDLPNDVQLHSIHLADCQFQVGSLGNTDFLENVYISSNSNFPYYQRLHLKLPKVMVGKLASSLTQAVALKHLTLQNIECFLNTFKTDYIDLSHHDQLQSIEIHNIPRCLSVINIRTVETMHVSTEMLALLQSSYSNATIQYLKIVDYSNKYDNLYTSSMNSRVQSLQQLQSISLEDVKIDENALTVSPAMQSLRKIHMFSVDMSLQTLYTFLDSICTLKQSVTIELMLIDKNKMIAARKHLIQNGRIFVTAVDSDIIVGIYD